MLKTLILSLLARLKPVREWLDKLRSRVEVALADISAELVLVVLLAVIVLFLFFL